MFQGPHKTYIYMFDLSIDKFIFNFLINHIIIIYGHYIHVHLFL